MPHRRDQHGVRTHTVRRCASELTLSLHLLVCVRACDQKAKWPSMDCSASLPLLRFSSHGGGHEQRNSRASDLCGYHQAA